MTRHASFIMEKYRQRANGLTSHFAAFGCGYGGEVDLFGETCLFKVPMSHSRQVAVGTRAHKGDSAMVKGIWVGKHDKSDDHLFLTMNGWHRARTLRRLPVGAQADASLLKQVAGAPWDARSAAPTRSKLRRMPIVAHTVEQPQAERASESMKEESRAEQPMQEEKGCANAIGRGGV